MEKMETGRQTSLPRSSPESLGIPSEAVQRFLDDIAARGIELHSVMILRHGQAASEGWWAPYQAEDKHLLFSLSKSFTSTAVGLAASEGLLTLDDKVVDWFPDQLPANVPDNLAAMRIRHLLMMGTGHAQDTTERMVSDPERNFVRGFLNIPVEHEPGSHFVYNNGATYMLSAILRKAAGVPLLDYLKPRLFEPLGIPDATWEVCPRGIAFGGWGLSLRTEDIAKFGLLYLQDGMWEGRRILPEGWVAEASAKHIPNGDNPDSDWNQGYGYQFWRCRHGAYRGDGAFGQFCIVLPEQDAVVAMTSATNDMQGAVNAVWEQLLPAMSEPLERNDEAAEQLSERLQALRIDPPQGEVGSELERQLHGRTYRMEKNELALQAVRFEFNDTEAAMYMTNPFNPTGSESIRLGRGVWLPNKVKLSGDLRIPQNVVPQKVEGSMHGQDGALVITLRSVETPFTFTCIIRPDGEDDVLLEMSASVSMGGPGAVGPVRGKAEPVSA